jgi:hypothetical protein
MTLRKAYAIFNAPTGTKHEKVGKIEECFILFGLRIFAKYLPKQRLIRYAIYDIVYGPRIIDLIAAGISEEELQALSMAEWNLCEVRNSLYHRVSY